MGIHCDSRKCTGCGVCAIACMDEKDREMKRGPLLRTITRRERTVEGELRISYTSNSCIHCVSVKCAPACPHGCIEKDEETGLVVHDASTCTGCGRCAQACRFGAIFFDEDHIIQKCDGCIDRVRCGLLPVCVEACPQQALQFDTI